jgi:XTP/dITP diphosphohydrolase
VLYKKCFLSAKTGFMQLVFATHNQNKIKEIKALLPHSMQLLSLKELGIHEDIPETADNLEANAMEKAQYVYTRYRMSCFADDSGLEVDALGGAPGVFSARYAGPACSYKDNNEKLLRKLQGIANRGAAFRTIIALILDGEKYIFEGKVRGQITREIRGKEGFGYDPLFIPDTCTQSYAEMPREEKNRISHRAKAFKQLIDFLEKKGNCI